MFHFYNEFGITDTITWYDLWYDRAKSSLQAIKEENMHIEMDTIVYVSSCPNSIINDDASVPPPVAPFRPKNGKRGASVSAQ